MSGGPGRLAAPRTRGCGGTRNPGETFGRASMTRIACSERGLAVFGASFSAAC
jgi:hypothetical protein